MVFSPDSNDVSVGIGTDVGGIMEDTIGYN
jgi:hypothetical protein